MRSAVMSLDDRTAGRSASSEFDAGLARVGEVRRRPSACSEFLRWWFDGGCDVGESNKCGLVAGGRLCALSRVDLVGGVSLGLCTDCDRERVRPASSGDGLRLCA